MRFVINSEGFIKLVDRTQRRVIWITKLDIYSHALIERHDIFTLRYIKSLTQRIITYEIQKESTKSKLKLHLRKGSLTAFYRHLHDILRHSDETKQEHCW